MNINSTDSLDILGSHYPSKSRYFVGTVAEVVAASLLLVIITARLIQTLRNRRQWTEGMIEASLSKSFLTQALNFNFAALPLRH